MTSRFEERLLEARKLAEEHANWYSKAIIHVYRDAFLHGYKHAMEELEKEVKDGQVDKQ